MKKISLVVAAVFAACGLFAQTTVTVREPGLVEGLVVGTGGIVSGVVGMTKDLICGRTVTYTTTPGVPVAAPVAAVPPCAVVTPAAPVYYQPAVVPCTPPVMVTPYYRGYYYPGGYYRPCRPRPCPPCPRYDPYLGGGHWGGLRPGPGPCHR